jgi:hypothetical protein
MKHKDIEALPNGFSPEGTHDCRTISRNCRKTEDGRRTDPALGQFPWRRDRRSTFRPFSRTPADSAEQRANHDRG